MGYAGWEERESARRVKEGEKKSQGTEWGVAKKTVKLSVTKFGGPALWGCVHVLGAGGLFWDGGDVTSGRRKWSSE